MIAARRRVGRWVLAVVSACMWALVCSTSSRPALAASPGDAGDPVPPKTYFEQGILIRSGETVDALGPDLMGDRVNEYSGDLSFTQSDVALPGNGALSVAVARHRNASTVQAWQASGLFGDWDLDLPHLSGIASASEPNWLARATRPGSTGAASSPSRPSRRS